MSYTKFKPNPYNTLELLTDAERLAQKLNTYGVSLMSEQRTGSTYTGVSVEYMAVQTQYGNVDHALYIPQTLSFIEAAVPGINRITLITGPELTSVPVPMTVVEQLKKKLWTFTDATLVENALAYMGDLPSDQRNSLAATFHIFIQDYLDSGFELTFFPHRETYVFEDIQNLFATDDELVLSTLTKVFDCFIREVFINASVLDPSSVPHFNTLLPALKHLDREKLDSLDPEKVKTVTPELIGAITHANTLLTRMKTHIVLPKYIKDEVFLSQDDVLALVKRYSPQATEPDYITVLENSEQAPHYPIFTVSPTKIDRDLINKVALFMVKAVKSLPHNQDYR